MATRSTISILLEDKKVRTIYCHWDGYLEGVGEKLKEYYNTAERVNALLDLGNISSLEPLLEEPILKNETFIEGFIDSFKPLHTFDTPIDGVTIAYTRDRGETGMESRIYDNYDSAQKEQYNYLFKDGEWFVGNDVRHLSKF